MRIRHLRRLGKLVQLFGKTMKKALIDEFVLLRQKLPGQTGASSEIRTVTFLTEVKIVTSSAGFNVHRLVKNDSDC
jgi:hypothetical protein